jgi:hypothetical protein
MIMIAPRGVISFVAGDAGRKLRHDANHIINNKYRKLTIFSLPALPPIREI